MSNLFNYMADLSGITEEEKLFVTKILHKTFIGVNETGTEAAAATAVFVDSTSVPLPPEKEYYFIADRPFIYYIRD